MAEANQKNAAVERPVQTVTVTIDGRRLTVPRGTTVLVAARQAGIDIPTFCWHPKLKPVGACRMCYVEIEKMGKLQVSCATEAVDGMVVHTDSDLVKRGRRAIIEFTLLNHPLDCPTCDKGGECDLQDLTFAHGFDDSRFDFQKYRFTSGTKSSTFDDKRIGPEIILNRNRCILCYRCVRANKEAFGEFDLGAYERGNVTEIHPAPAQEVDNPFSGNLVEICPVGALTNTDWRYKIRVWLTQTASSIDPFSSSGANIMFFKEDHQSRIFRVTSRRNDEIDDGWISDIARYGYQYVMSDDRLQTPLIKKEGRHVKATWEEALEVVGRRLKEIDEKKGCVCIGGLVSPTLDHASLHSFSKLIRVAIGSNNIDFRSEYRMLPKSADNPYDIVASRPFKIANIDDSDVILTLGTDLIREHHNEYLRIRKACLFGRAHVYSMTPYQTKAGDLARRELVYKPGTEEILLNAICLAAIEENIAGPNAGDLKAKIKPKTMAQAAAHCGVDPEAIREVAWSLSSARKITVFGGEIVSRSFRRETIAAAMCNLNRLFDIERRGQIAILARHVNSTGASRLGVGPIPSPAVQATLTEMWGRWPEGEARNTDSMLVHMKKEEIHGGIIFGANPAMLYPDREFAREGLERLDFLVVADMFESETTNLADVVLPLASWAEYDGYYTSLEGRTQLAGKAVNPRFQSKPAYEIAELIAEQMGTKLFASVADRETEIARLLAIDPVMAWPDGFIEAIPAEIEIEKDYPLALFIGDDPHHCGHLTEKSVSLVNFASEAYIEMSPALAARHALIEGDPVRVESPIGKVIVPVRISPHIRNDAVFIPRNFSSTPVTSLLMRKRRVDWVRLSKVVS
jgi:NADH-quinone oxidoreductase subunit G